MSFPHFPGGLHDGVGHEVRRGTELALSHERHRVDAHGVEYRENR